MHNRPFSQFDFDAGDTRSGTVDPRRRLRILAVVTVTGLLIVAGRVVHVQHYLAERFLTHWDQLVPFEEQTPSHDGRILSRDGVVLACEESRYDIAIEYRWLESPPDPHWLRAQTLQLLTRQERNEPAARKRAADDILTRREALLNALADVTHHPRAEIDQRLARIQQRIEAMANSVEERRRNRVHQLASDVDEEPGLSGMVQRVVHELTTPPDRSADDPVILKEELAEHVVIEDVPFEIASAIRSQPAKYPGVHIRSQRLRLYPQGDLAAHLIGVRRPRTGVDGSLEMVGESGIERSRDSQLRGRSGQLKQWRNRRGKIERTEQIADPQDGNDVMLTIDSRLQQIAEQVLDQALAETEHTETQSAPVGGCLIIMDIWTGDLLALASAPRPALNVLSRPSPEEWRQLNEDPRQVLFSRTTRMAIPPGSVFKIVTAAAGLESGLTSADEIIPCRGYLDRPDQFRCLIYRRTGSGHQDVTLDDALCQSCNVYFYELARRLGPERLTDWAERFGFGAPTGLDALPESSGHLPRPSQATAGRRWQPGDTLHLSVGQGELLTTPLQIVRMMAAIANGGYLVRPQVTVTQDAKQRQPPEPIPELSERTLFAIRKGMESVVQDPRGTGRGARIEMLSIAGKTGTAEVSQRPDHAWFAGYAPIRSPRLAFVVVLEHGGSGGKTAAMMRDVLIEAVGLGFLRPDESR